MAGTIDQDIASGALDSAIPATWEEALGAEVHMRCVPVAILLRQIFHAWLREQRLLIDDARERRYVRQSDEDRLRVRLLARIADCHAAHREISVADLADRLGLSSDAVHAALIDLTAIGLLTAARELTARGEHFLNDCLSDAVGFVRMHTHDGEMLQRAAD
ncbi:MAG: hypothetical protein ACR2JW_13815 [Thermomicrobiales bacterium]